jgi:hypothetical protein
MVPTTKTKRKVFYGSCRKIHTFQPKSRNNADATAATSFSIDAGFISLKRLRTTNLMDDGEVLIFKT